MNYVRVIHLVDVLVPRESKVNSNFKLTKKPKQSSDLHSLVLLYPAGGDSLFLLHPAGGSSSPCRWKQFSLTFTCRETV
jgi:hypothetical protein